ncbi:SCO family protein [Desulfospira joergensenii]|uniref:SCO family protein n=1 Tax=Desulfospira joergensenii TaxID=53329 RepID=UPI0003B73716|nr:SCO family protein [Desulfospira joergensenii]
MRSSLNLRFTWGILLGLILFWTLPGIAQNHESGHDSTHGSSAEPSMAHDSPEMQMDPDTDADPMDKHKHHVMGQDPAAEKLPEDEALELASKVRVEEKLGSFIDKDAAFTDENGNPIKIGDLLDKPVVLLPIYFFCPTICSFLQADLVKVINDIDPVPGRDFNLVTLSFSRDETPENALDAKKNYARLVTKEFPLENWHYLTGTPENIKRVTDSLGFHFIRKEKHLYVHPNVLIVLAQGGKITRYVYGPNFLPFDVGMALAEADQGKTGISIKRGVMSFCFNYDPEKQTYAFNIFRVAGTVILLFLAGLVLFLVFAPGKKRK